MSIQAQKTILITGATGCLGRALALRAAEQNATLILHGRNIQKLEQLDDDIQTLKSTKTILWPLDFLNASDAVIASTMQELNQAVESIHIIFNCAIKLGQQTPILQEEHNVWQDVMQVNFEAPRILLKHCMPLLTQTQQAQIVFFENQRQNENMYEGAFGCSKIMVQHLSNQLNREFEKLNHIRSVIIQVQPLFSALRAKTFPGEDPTINTSASDEAERIFHLLNR